VPEKFLSDEWITEAKKIREEFAGKGTPPAHAVRMNQVITDVPFGDGTLNVHMDTSGGDLEFDLGHLDTPDLRRSSSTRTRRPACRPSWPARSRCRAT